MHGWWWWLWWWGGGLNAVLYYLTNTKPGSSQWPCSSPRICPKKFFCAKRASKIIVPPKEMLFSFSTGTFLTNNDVTNRKHKINLIYSIVQKRTIWKQNKSMETAPHNLPWMSSSDPSASDVRRSHCINNLIGNFGEKPILVSSSGCGCYSWQLVQRTENKEF